MILMMSSQAQRLRIPMTALVAVSLSRFIKGQVGRLARCPRPIIGTETREAEDCGIGATPTSQRHDDLEGLAENKSSLPTTLFRASHS